MRRKQAPSQRMVDHIKLLINKRKILLAKEAELVSASRPGAAARLAMAHHSRPSSTPRPVPRASSGSSSKAS